MPAQRQPWFASPWWTDFWGPRACALFCFALSAEGFWCAAKFGGAWAYAYGGAAIFGLLLGVAFLTSGRRIRR